MSDSFIGIRPLVERGGGAVVATGVSGARVSVRRLHDSRPQSGLPNVPKRTPPLAYKHRYRASSAGRVGAWGSFKDLVGAGEQGRRHGYA
jgi:hypothetical protein